MYILPTNPATPGGRPARGNRHESFGPSTEIREDVARSIQQGLAPELVGRMVRDAVVRDDLYIFTHAVQRAEVEGRFERILAAFDDIEKRGTQA